MSFIFKLNWSYFSSTHHCKNFISLLFTVLFSLNYSFHPTLAVLWIVWEKVWFSSWVLWSGHSANARMILTSYHWNLRISGGNLMRSELCCGQVYFLYRKPSTYLIIWIVIINFCNNLLLLAQSIGILCSNINKFIFINVCKLCIKYLNHMPDYVLYFILIMECIFLHVIIIL